MEKRSVAVMIAGHEYRILSDDDEDSLHRVAKQVDEAMRAIRQRTGSVDTLDVAILAALNFAKEILALRGEAPAGRSGRTSGSAGLDPRRLRRLIELAESALEEAEEEAASEPDRGESSVSPS